MSKKKYVFIALSGLLIVAAVIMAAVFLTHKGNNGIPAFLDPGNKFKTDLPETTLVFAFEGKDTDKKQDVLKAVEEKAKNELNIKLEFICFESNPDQWLGILKSAIASGQSFDGFYYSDAYPSTLKTMANDGDLKDLTDIFPKCAPDCYNALTGEELKSASVNGKIYMVPRFYHSAQIMSALVRDDLMQKYKIPDIKNYVDYEKYLKAVKENEKGIIPMVINGNAIGLSSIRKDTTIDLFAQTNGYVILDSRDGLVYKWDDPKMKIMAWEQTPGFIEGINRINSWGNKGYLLREMPILALDNTSAASDKFASILSYYGDEVSYNVALKGKGVSWSYKAYPLTSDYPASMGSTVCGIAIPATSNNAERVLMFMNWLESDQENYDSLMYGIKGTTYNLKSNDIVDPTACLNWAWRAPFLNEKLERGNPAISKETLNNYIDTVKKIAKYPPHTGFVPDYAAVKDISNRREVEYINMGYKIYVTGGITKDDINKYIQDEKDSGVNDLIAEVQKQLDKWAAENVNN